MNYLAVPVVMHGITYMQFYSSPLIVLCCASIVCADCHQNSNIINNSIAMVVLVISMGHPSTKEHFLSVLTAALCIDLYASAGFPFNILIIGSTSFEILILEFKNESLGQPQPRL